MSVSALGLGCSKCSLCPHCGRCTINYVRALRFGCPTVLFVPIVAVVQLIICALCALGVLLFSLSTLWPLYSLFACCGFWIFYCSLCPHCGCCAMSVCALRFGCSTVIIVHIVGVVQLFCVLWVLDVLLFSLSTLWPLYN